MVSKGVFTQSNFSFKFASSVHPFQTQLYQSKHLSYTLPIFDGLIKCIHGQIRIWIGCTGRVKGKEFPLILQ